MNIKNDCIVKSSIAPLYLNPSFKSELVSQALIWEYLIILEIKNNWFKVKQWDEYVSWIHNSYVLNIDVYKNNNLNNHNKWYYLTKSISKNNILLSFGSCLPVISDNKDGSYQILLPDLSRIKVNKKNLISYNNALSMKEILKFAKYLKGVPYLWGGKSSFGYDCSGFIQSLLRLKGIKFPRDCSEQINSHLIEIKISNKFALGDLIFFIDSGIATHVGMYINNNKFIHASGQVRINSIDNKNKYYCDKLSKLDYEVYRFKNN